MTGQVCYLKLKRGIMLSENEVTIGQAADIFCIKKEMQEDIRKLKLMQITESKKKRFVIGILDMIAVIQEKYPSVRVESIGETDVIVEYVPKKQRSIWEIRAGQMMKAMKVIFVCLITFCGTAFTIMAYHNDIGINDVFSGIMRMATGENLPGVSVLELSYSIGLSVGIVVFFNHVGKKRITSDPTPVEVEMYQYKTDVARTIVEMAEREEKT